MNKTTKIIIVSFLCLAVFIVGICLLRNLNQKEEYKPVGATLSSTEPTSTTTTTTTTNGGVVNTNTLPAGMTGEDLAKIKAYALNFREQIKSLNQMRMAEAMNRSDSDPFYEDVPFSSTENGTHFEISSNDVLDGDKDELPI